ncbi:EAL domain-containing protein [Sphingomonas sp. 2R-10]|uniref:EAL domain-containing protein n=1 Tax=Sphingomonas sp. 2R-10 TaxID=3045148 RepID=UPI000F7B20EC|nr:EAL domain-containing protein [Sphingomonas sp. 2R-10]MDJ0276312.1 EAL domain-containing protein [Sphingomonas sp. 2R-10]
MDNPDLGRRLADLYAGEDTRFDALVRAACLAPDRDFRDRDLRALRFEDADLRGFDLSGSDLRGTGLRHARHVDRTTGLTGAILDDDDADWIVRRSQVDSRDRVELVRDLRQAIDRRQFELVFQPKVDLKSRKVTGAEALLRWQHPDRGHVAPATFVPLLEEEGLIEAVTYWTIEAAIERQRILRKRGFDLVVALNISPMMMGERDFIRNCAHVLGGERPRLCFEITETALIAEPETVPGYIRELEAMGIVVAIDDYGTGFSSLGLLKGSGARELKIDGSFIRQIGNDHSEPLIVRSTIDLAHALDMEVTAEGVETEAQLSLLTMMGCDAAQGFFISRPLTLDALIAHLEASAEVPVETGP